MAIELIGVTFDSYGRPGTVASAPMALRAAGLQSAVGQSQAVRDAGDLSLPAPSPERAPGSGLINQDALVALADAVEGAVKGAWADRRFPLLYGGDCAALLGALPAARDQFGSVGLLFVDGHEDAYPLETSPDGQAADSEIALLLGESGDALPAALARRLPALSAASLAMLGPRKVGDRPTLEGRAWLRHDSQLLDGDLASLASEAVGVVGAGGRRWWLHIDLDVLSQAEFAAHDFPEPGGIDWPRLEQISAIALGASGCIGWSVVIYNPDLDADGGVAKRIVRFLADGARHRRTEGLDA